MNLFNHKWTIVLLTIISSAWTFAQSTQPAPQLISGRVVDAGGKPAAGAMVVAYFWNPATQRSDRRDAVSAADGRFTINRPATRPDADPLGTTVIFAAVPGVGFSRTIVPESTGMELRLMPSADVHLSFVDSQGKPVAGYKIYPTTILPIVEADATGDVLPVCLEKDICALWTVSTDADGKCIVHGVARKCSVQFESDDDRFAQMSLEDEVSTTGDAVTTWPPIRLFAPASVAGQVMNPETGKPAAGFRLIGTESERSVYHDMYRDVVTDSEGRYEMKHIKPGPFKVGLYLADDKMPEWTAPPMEFELYEGLATTANMTLSRGGFVTVRTRDSESGKPLAARFVSIYRTFDANGDRSGSEGGTAIDADGKHTFRLPAGRHNIVFEDNPPEGYLAPKEKVIVVDLALGQTQEVTFEFPRDPTPSLSGTVVDPDGNPVAGAKALCDNPPLEGKSVTTDAQGNFRIPAVSKGASIRARWKDMATATAIKVDDPHVSMTVPVSPNGLFSLVVKASDKDGAIVPKTSVELTIRYVEGGLGGPFHPLGPDGEFTFDSLFTDTSYAVSAQAPGYGLASAQLRKSHAGQQNISLTLKKATSVISGIVTDELGTPLPNIEVSISGLMTTIQMTTADDRGRFSFAVVDDEKDATVYFHSLDGRVASSVQAKAGDTDVQLVSHPLRTTTGP